MNRAYSFKPEINEVSEELIKGQDFFERLERFRSLKNEKIKNHELSKLDQSHLDPVTGQELFRPTVGRPPRSSVIFFFFINKFLKTLNECKKNYIALI